MKTIALTATLAVALTSVSACASAGGGRNTPDEFRVLTKAPLTVPPEYALRPPSATEARPPEFDPSLQTVSATFGSNVGLNASPIELRVVADANALATSPLIRAQVDFETSKILRKPSDITDAVLSTADTSANEAADSATGGGDVVIEQRRSGGRIKLPGT